MNIYSKNLLKAMTLLCINAIVSAPASVRAGCVCAGAVLCEDWQGGSDTWSNGEWTQRTGGPSTITLVDQGAGDLALEMAGVDIHDWIRWDTQPTLGDTVIEK